MSRLLTDALVTFAAALFISLLMREPNESWLHTVGYAAGTAGIVWLVLRACDAIMGGRRG